MGAGHGSGSGVRYFVALALAFGRIVIDTLVVGTADRAEGFARALQRPGAASVGEDAEVTDAVHPVGQDMEQEAADELVDADGHGAVAGLALPWPLGLLAATAAGELDLDIYSGVIVIFRSRRGDRLKLLAWDGSGLVMTYKRLEQGRFAWPRIEDGVMRLTKGQFEALFEGLDWRRVKARPVRRPLAAE